MRFKNKQNLFTAKEKAELMVGVTVAWKGPCGNFWEGGNNLFPNGGGYTYQNSSDGICMICTALCASPCCCACAPELV
jgi:hypothetical protein